MSVTNALGANPQVRTWNPGPDLSLPCGEWWTDGQVTGDGSGGTASVLLPIPAVGAYGFNLEWISPEVVSGNPMNASLIFFVGKSGLVAANLAIKRTVYLSGTSSGALALAMGGGALGSAAAMQDDFRRELITFGDGAGALSLSVVFQTNTNALVYTAQAGGFVWDWRARNYGARRLTGQPGPQGPL